MYQPFSLNISSHHTRPEVANIEHVPKRPKYKKKPKRRNQTGGRARKSKKQKSINTKKNSRKQKFCSLYALRNFKKNQK